MTRNSTEARILVVDDDQSVRAALKRSFLNEGWQVSCAASGREALDILAQQQPFNVIVADYFMPNINGIEFLLKVDQKYPQIFCIMLTAYPYCDAIKRALSKTPNIILLEKPWDERLEQIIARVIAKQQLAQQILQA